MKRKVLYILLASFLLSGVASAASLWGNYNGNPIIRITVDGTPVNVYDVPAMLYNNRTMVPIYLLQQAGIQYTWDEQNQTVDIKSVTAKKEDVIKLKNLFFAADLFKQLAFIGYMDLPLSNTLLIAYDDLLHGGTRNAIEQAKSYLNQTKDGRNTYFNFANERSSYLNSQGILVKSKSTQIINNYNKSLKSYEEAFDYLMDYKQYRLQTDLDSFFNKLDEAVKSLHEGLRTSEEEYQYYSNLISNYNTN